MAMEETELSKKSCETYAYFYVYDFDRDISEINDMLGLKPSVSWLKGDEWLPGKPRSFDSWQLHSPIERSEVFMNVHIDAVLKLIEPKRSFILDLESKGCTIGINCVGYYYSEHPGFHLSAELVARLASLSMDIDFDLYCLCGDEGDESEDSTPV